MQTVLNENESDVWKQIAPLLDAAMAGLNETDRHAVVLRFFDGKSLGEVSAALGASDPSSGVAGDDAALACGCGDNATFQERTSAVAR